MEQSYTDVLVQLLAALAEMHGAEDPGRIAATVFDHYRHQQRSTETTSSMIGDIQRAVQADRLGRPWHPVI